MYKTKSNFINTDGCKYSRMCFETHISMHLHFLHRFIIKIYHIMHHIRTTNKIMYIYRHIFFNFFFFICREFLNDIPFKRGQSQSKYTLNKYETNAFEKQD